MTSQAKQPKYMTDSLGRNTMRWTNTDDASSESAKRAGSVAAPPPPAPAQRPMTVKRADLPNFVPENAPIIQARLEKTRAFDQQLIDSYDEGDPDRDDAIARASTAHERVLNELVTDVNEYVTNILDIHPDHRANKYDHISIGFIIEHQDEVFGGGNPIRDAIEDYLNEKWVD